MENKQIEVGIKILEGGVTDGMEIFKKLIREYGNFFTDKFENNKMGNS